MRFLAYPDEGEEFFASTHVFDGDGEVAQVAEVGGFLGLAGVMFPPRGLFGLAGGFKLGVVRGGGVGWWVYVGIALLRVARGGLEGAFAVGSHFESPLRPLVFT